MSSKAGPKLASFSRLEAQNPRGEVVRHGVAGSISAMLGQLSPVPGGPLTLHPEQARPPEIASARYVPPPSRVSPAARLTRGFEPR
ncbi:MAG: hypothetical protein OXN89_09290 [Bryobacterales bacterium]|nr:hypothetical protein [Bryobacterales bacterium]